MKSAFQEDDNDFYQENYDTNSDYDDNEEHEDDDNDDRCHVEEEEDFYEKNYPDDIVNEDYDYYNIVRTKIRDRIKKMTMVMSTDRPTLNTSLGVSRYFHYNALDTYNEQKKALPEEDEKGDLQENYDDDIRDNVEIETNKEKTEVQEKNDIEKQKDYILDADQVMSDLVTCPENIFNETEVVDLKLENPKLVTENNPNVKIDSDNESSTNYGTVDEGKTESKQTTVEECEENNMKEDTDNEKVEFISDKKVREKNPMLKTKSIDQSNVNSNLYNRNTGVVKLVPSACPHGGVWVHQQKAGVWVWIWDPGIRLAYGQKPYLTRDDETARIRRMIISIICCVNIFYIFVLTLSNMRGGGLKTEQGINTSIVCKRKDGKHVWG